MTTVSILPIETDRGDKTYLAVAGGRQSAGKTAGEALDAISAQLGEDRSSTLVVVQHHRPDRFFSAEQQQRMEELMALWRSARDAGSTLSAEEQSELNALVDAEVRATADRAAALADELGK
jgi:hypothetical protein